GSRTTEMMESSAEGDDRRRVKETTKAAAALFDGLTKDHHRSVALWEGMREEKRKRVPTDAVT
ncbi:hypothetical protein PIB30_080148, partial [Stylosanthes scabra]|nr:hypothetical protein [Stylosanthes scabra]